MPPNAVKALQTVSLVGQHKTAIVVGGTLGIGAAIARHLAKLGCSRVIIFGRNEARGAAVLEELKRLAPKDTSIEVEFVKGELSCVFSLLYFIWRLNGPVRGIRDVQSMRAAAEALQKAGGERGIDYLVRKGSSAIVAISIY